VKIAIIVPWIRQIKGTSLACAFSRALSEFGETVEFVVHTINIAVENDLKQILGEKVRLTILNRVVDEKINPLIYLQKQYFSKIDGDIVKLLTSSKNKYDQVILISNEGRRIGNKISRKFRNNLNDKPATILLLQELIDYSFTIGKEGIPAYIRRLFSLVKPLFRYIEKKRLRGFDLIYSNSDWTSKNLSVLYGINARMPLALYDDYNFKLLQLEHKEELIVVPTASLDKNGIDLLLRLQEDGIPLIAFGSKRIRGIKNVGFLTTIDMCKLISKSKATLFYFDYEALGLIPLESLSLGTPVITIPKQGPYEELKLNKFVYFFKDYDSLLKICKNLLETNQDSVYRQTCSESVNNFHAEVVASRFLVDVKNCLIGDDHA
jgi:glycosyltransferase involved in cell wall biosynthesis